MAQFTRENIEFQTSDGVTLRGWFYKPASIAAARLPCLVISNGFAATKEMRLNIWGECFSSRLPLICLVYDNRGFGDSDTKEGSVRQEINPSLQTSDISDAITYAQARDDVNPDKIGIWGTSFSGGNVLCVGAIDRRVRAVISQVPLVDGWQNYHALVPNSRRKEMEEMFQAGPSNFFSFEFSCQSLFKSNAIIDRLGRLRGEKPLMIPIIDADPFALSAMATVDSYNAMSVSGMAPGWKNEVTAKRSLIF
jgi:hypothetical protein